MDKAIHRKSVAKSEGKFLPSEEELDPDKIPQFGLVVEEVEKINPT